MEFDGPQSHVAVVDMPDYTGEVLVDLWPDGRVTLAFRRYKWNTWSPPVRAVAPATVREHERSEMTWKDGASNDA